MRGTKRKSEAVTRGEAARMLGVHKTTIRRYETEGRLVAVRQPNGVHLFKRRAVELLAARRRRKARELEARELVLSARDVARLAAALGFDARAASSSVVVAQAERLRARLREARTAAPRS